MNKNDYLAALNKELKRLPEEERRNAIQYYMEYFDDAGEENADRVIGELGSPKKVASQIVSEYAVKRINLPTETFSKMNFGKIKWVIVALIASPIALPVAFCILAFIASICLITVCSVVVTVLAATSLIGISIAGAAIGLSIMASDFATGIFACGIALASVGCGILFALLSVLLGKLIIKGVKKLVTVIAKRRNKHVKV